MLAEHGVFPHEVVTLPLKEKILMQALLNRHAKEIEKIKKKK